MDGDNGVTRNNIPDDPVLPMRKVTVKREGARSLVPLLFIIHLAKMSQPLFRIRHCVHFRYKLMAVKFTITQIVNSSAISPSEDILHSASVLIAKWTTP